MTRLMCSENPEKVAAVKSELFKAGICSQIRKNPVTELLQIKRLELWVENESDFFVARELYTALQARTRNGDELMTAEDPAGSSTGMQVLPAPSAGRVSRATPDPNHKNQSPCGELEEASTLLEKEIEEVLQREDALAETCAALRSEVEGLRRSLSESQAATEKTAAKFAGVRSSLERELAERTRSEESLKGNIRELQSRLEASEETFLDQQKKMETAVQQLQTQQAMVVELRKELVSLEQEREADQREVSKAQAELAVERQSRIEAEEQAAKSTDAQARLEKQLADQAGAQEKLRASIESMNSLRSRLQAKKKFFE